jgi:hypothetical protein
VKSKTIESCHSEREISNNRNGLIELNIFFEIRPIIKRLPRIEMNQDMKKIYDSGNNRPITERSRKSE